LWYMAAIALLQKWRQPYMLGSLAILWGVDKERA
jgi:hypothetical protein